MNRLALVALAVLAVALAADAARHAAAFTRADGTADAAPLHALARAAGHEARELATGLLPLAEAPGEGRGVLLAGGGRTLGEREGDALARFAGSGGRALVLGDAEAAAALGVDVVAEPVAARADAGIPATWEGRAFALPDARALLDRREGAVAVARTANGTFIDVDGDGRATGADAAGPFVVATRDAAGRAVVVGSRALADPRVADADARAFIEDVARKVFPPGIELLVDASRGARLASALARAPLAVALDVAHVPALGALAVALLAAAGYGVAARPGRGRGGP